jgi:hypothetical protein
MLRKKTIPKKHFGYHLWYVITAKVAYTGQNFTALTRTQLIQRSHPSVRLRLQLMLDAVSYLWNE